MRAAAIFVLGATCACSARDLSVVAPDIEDARAVLVAKLDARGATLESFALDASAPLEVDASSATTIALMFYREELASLRIPSGAIDVPSVAPSVGDRLPFERGFARALDDDSAMWTELDALPSWLDNVRIPAPECPPLTVEAHTFVEGARLAGLAGDGHRALAFVNVSVGAVRTFLITATATAERGALFPEALRVLDAKTRLDGTIIVAAVDHDNMRTYLYQGTVTGTFAQLAQLNRDLPELELELGHTQDDRNDVFLLTRTGELLFFDGSTFARWRPRDPAGDARYRLAWAGPHAVVMFGLEGALTRWSAGNSVDIGGLDNLGAFSLTYVPDRGTLLGTTTGEVLVLAGDRFEPYFSNAIFSLAVLSAAIYRGEVATGGSSGAFAWRRESSPCYEQVSGTSATMLVPLDDGLLAGNRTLGEDPLVVVIH